MRTERVSEWVCVNVSVWGSEYIEINKFLLCLTGTGGIMQSILYTKHRHSLKHEKTLMKWCDRIVNVFLYQKLFDIHTYLWCIDTQSDISINKFLSFLLSVDFFLTWPIKMTWISRYIYYIFVMNRVLFLFLSKFV